MAYVNTLTGEILDLTTMSDEEIVGQLRGLEQMAQQTRSALNAAKGELQERMEADGAKLRLTSTAKLRLHKKTKVRDNKLVKLLYQECPKVFKESCFAFDVRPLKKGLNELAKLGSDWRQKVDAIYEETYSLKVEWNDEGEAG